MGAWEKTVRINIADIQRQYKEKYKALYKLNFQGVKKPSKPRYPSAESTSPKKAIKPVTPSSDKESLAWVPKAKQSHPKKDHHNTSKKQKDGCKSWNDKKDLSDITTKFKSSRPNPFENLLRLSSHKVASTIEPMFTSTPKISKPENGELAEEANRLVFYLYFF